MTTQQDFIGGTLIPRWTLGDRLRKARELAGLQQIELAAELGIHRGSVANYESGRTTPNRPVVMAWALRCGVPFEWLRDGQAPEATEPYLRQLTAQLGLTRSYVALPQARQDGLHSAGRAA